MPWTNYHSHSHYCDGSHSLEENINSAIRKGIVALGISSHAPVYFQNPWSMKKNRVQDYLNEIETLKVKYRDRIQIYKSMEVDYIPGKSGPRSGEFLNYNLDYVIGSVHFIGYFDDGKPWGIDGTATLYERGMNEIYGGNARQAVKDFYNISRQMIKTECPDIIGHIDKVRMHNQTAGRFFNVEDAWYRDEIHETLDLIGEKDAIVEVNTRGMYKGYTGEPYPSCWILKEVYKRGIPIQLNSDSHHPDEIDGAFHETASQLLSIGFRTMRVLLNGEWQDVAFDENGLIMPDRYPKS